MEVNAGFDMIPPLSDGIDDRTRWNRFVNAVKDFYKDDTRVETTRNCIVFKVGEHPMIPLEGHKLLRFSSEISGHEATAEGVLSYIHDVTRLAIDHFGLRAQAWDEGVNQYGHYDWNEVNDSIRSYYQPDNPTKTTSEAEMSSGAGPHPEPKRSLFEIKTIEGKGKGLVASIDIPAGTRILCEKPLIRAETASPDELERTVTESLRSLSLEGQRQFLSLHNNFPGKRPFSGIFQTNALLCGPRVDAGAVYPTACLINHSCLPNCHQNWNDHLEHETIHAIRPILAGEEITIQYDQGGPSAVRQNSLKKDYGFQCKCEVCSLPTVELQASDNRRIRMKDLDQEIVEQDRISNNPEKSLADCLSLLHVLDEEWGVCAEPFLDRLCYDAFQICIVHGDRARAKVFAERAYRAGVLCEGEDSPNTQRMKSLAENPEAHRRFGLHSMKWKTAKTSVPWNFGTAQFEKWLFRA